MHRIRSKRARMTKSYLTAVITIAVLTVISAVSMLGSAVITIAAVKSEIQLTAGTESAEKTFLQKLVEYCFPTAGRYDYTKEEVRFNSKILPAMGVNYKYALEKPLDF